VGDPRRALGRSRLWNAFPMIKINHQTRSQIGQMFYHKSSRGGSYIRCCITNHLVGDPKSDVISQIISWGILYPMFYHKSSRGGPYIYIVSQIISWGTLEGPLVARGCETHSLWSKSITKHDPKSVRCFITNHLVGDVVSQIISWGTLNPMLYHKSSRGGPYIRCCITNHLVGDLKTFP
jgi:hypothetical protein